MMSKIRQAWTVGMLLLLVACNGGAAEPITAPAAPASTLPPAAAGEANATDTPTSTGQAAAPPAAESEEVSAAATDSPAPVATATAAPAAPDVAINGRHSEDGAFFRGRADAPVTLADYSDFL